MFANLLLAACTLGGCATWSTYDAGGGAQYPATVVHYAPSVAEDVAGRDCTARGGSMIDDAAERFVCVVD